MSDEKQGRGRPPKDPVLSGYGETKLLSVKVPAAQYDRILQYIQQRFETEGLHLGVSDVVRFALVQLGINGIAEGKNAVNDAQAAAEQQATVAPRRMKEVGMAEQQAAEQQLPGKNYTPIADTLLSTWPEETAIPDEYDYGTAAYLKAHGLDEGEID